MSNEVATLEKTVKKLISEEYFAGQLYFLFRNALTTTSKNASDFRSSLIETSTDELNDHMLGLIAAARIYGLDVPVSCPEFKIFAGKKDTEAFMNIKKGKDIQYYIDESIESEKRAIISYNEALAIPCLMDYPELYSRILNNLYDEQDHLETFLFSQYVNSIESNY